VLWFAAYNVALNAAERRIDSGTASLLVNTSPLLLLLFAGLLLHEGFPRRLIGGGIVSFAGVVLIGGAVSGHGVAATWAAALCLLAALAYALGLIAQKPALRGASPLAITWAACTVAAVVCLPWAPGLVHQAHHAPVRDLVWVAYLGLGPTAIGFGCWTFALSRSSAGRLGVVTFLVPPLTVLLGWVLLSETPPLLALPGGILCLAGVALGRRTPRRGGRARAPEGAIAQSRPQGTSSS
jgi:drug/metabolite transporter (DMT)-like permease